MPLIVAWLEGLEWTLAFVEKDIELLGVEVLEEEDLLDCSS